VALVSVYCFYPKFSVSVSVGSDYSVQLGLYLSRVCARSVSLGSYQKWQADRFELEKVVAGSVNSKLKLEVV
jgi:hypothetical protein